MLADRLHGIAADRIRHNTRKCVMKAIPGPSKRRLVLLERLLSGYSKKTITSQEIETLTVGRLRWHVGTFHCLLSTAVRATATRSLNFARH